MILKSGHNNWRNLQYTAYITHNIVFSSYTGLWRIMFSFAGLDENK